MGDYSLSPHHTSSQPPSAPDEQEGEQYSCGENPYGRDTGSGEDHSILQHRMVHNEVIVHLVGLLFCYLP